MSDPVKVFISYSWEDEAHYQRVKGLVDRLRGGGIDCVLDRYVFPPPRQGWVSWMHEQIRAAHFVLVICSEKYNRKANEPVSSGVRTESARILQELHEKGMLNERFLPVKLVGHEPVWDPLASFHFYKVEAEEDYEYLYRHLTGQPPEIPPPLGEIKILPPKNAPSTSAAPAVLQETPAIERPAWASAVGEDGYGRWAEFRVGEVVQRMRWIQPGKFWMGSPESEEGRFDAEGPRHLVTLSKGFWLGDTPCTQALWQTVMGANPSRFMSPERPVETVSWDDCQDFLLKLNARLPDLAPRLPTEAEWEYACRAGTETSTYAGELKILGERNAPLLDGIAWYGGNSGLGYELDTGADSSGWKEKQYGHKKAGTRLVKQKRPNPLGLYDVLGNVWEWCQDRWGPYNADSATSPAGPGLGSRRVFRGGSWLNGARNVRAAARDADPPDYRYDNLGFRLARGQQPLR